MSHAAKPAEPAILPALEVGEKEVIRQGKTKIGSQEEKEFCVHEFPNTASPSPKKTE